MIKNRKSLYNTRPLTVQEAERRHRNIAKAYFQSIPSIGNLYNGVVHYLKSLSILPVEGTNIITGTAPTPITRGDILNQYSKYKNASKWSSRAFNRLFRPGNDWRNVEEWQLTQAEREQRKLNNMLRQFRATRK